MVDYIYHISWIKIKTVIGKKKCRCRRRKKICANGEKRPAITTNDSMEQNVFGNAISVTTEPFITEKHIDDFPIKDLEDMSTNLTLFNLGAGHNTVNR